MLLSFIWVFIQRSSCKHRVLNGNFRRDIGLGGGGVCKTISCTTCATTATALSSTLEVLYYFLDLLVSLMSTDYPLTCLIFGHSFVRRLEAHLLNFSQDDRNVDNHANPRPCYDANLSRTASMCPFLVLEV